MLSTTNDLILTNLCQAVRAKAAEQPDFVYEAPPNPDHHVNSTACVYVYGEKGSCIVGCAALDVGLIDLSIEGTTRNLDGVTALLDHKVPGLSDEIVLEPGDWQHAYNTDYRVMWLEEVQGEQDNGVAWARAVEMADAKVAELCEVTW